MLNALAFRTLTVETPAFNVTTKLRFVVLVVPATLNGIAVPLYFKNSLLVVLVKVDNFPETVKVIFEIDCASSKLLVVNVTGVSVPLTIDWNILVIFTVASVEGDTLTAILLKSSCGGSFCGNTKTAFAPPLFPAGPENDHVIKLGSGRGSSDVL